MRAYEGHFCICLGFLFILFHGGSATGCGGELRDFEGTIRSPGYPGSYPPGIICTWDIIAPAEHHIILKFTHFDLEDGHQYFDYVSISDFAGFSQSFKGRNFPYYTGKGNHLRVTFKSDNSNEFSGFSADYATEFSGDVGSDINIDYLPDITTVFSIAEHKNQHERDPIEFYSRTNALGFTYHWPNYTNIEPFFANNDPIYFYQSDNSWMKQGVGKVTSQYHGKMLELLTTSSSLTSPLLIPKGPKGCFHIFLSGQNSATLSFSILNFLGQESWISNSTVLVNTWKITVSFDIQDSFKDGIKLKLSKLNQQFLAIRGVTKCVENEESEQSYSVSKELTSDTANEAQRFHSKLLQLHPQSENGLQCNNGGVVTKFGCACHAGFTGPNCEKGCGANRFGQDCGGECSKLGQQCKGLLLCTPGVGCDCAPGYHGLDCTRDCTTKREEYSYGSNCSQVCGRCSSEERRCDIYTGECPKGCEDGYWPPYCKQKLVHALNAPVLTASEYGVLSVSVDINKNNREGEGNATFYQIQYKKQTQEDWIVHRTKKISGETKNVMKISGLENGIVYSVRMIFLTENYNRYDNSDVPEAVIRTKCYVPSRYSYNISAKHVKDYYDVFTTVFSWTYEGENNWCPSNKVEVSYKLGLKWDTFETSWRNDFSIANMLPNRQILFKVRAITDDQIKAPFSLIFSAMTPIGGPYKVENVTIENMGANMCTLNWDVFPRFFDLNSTVFKVVYECLERTSCKEDCFGSKGELSTSETTVVLRGLLPTSRYQITITANEGEPTVLIVGTKSSDPSEVPLAMEENVDSLETEKAVDKSNTSITMQWRKGEVCSGYFENFAYELYEANNLENILEQGRTDLTQITFTNLKPDTDYECRVFIETIDGKKSNKFLSINASTDSTVPEQVRNLTVYRQGQHLLGLRWAKPRMVYGELEGFTVSYWQKNQPTNKKSENIKPTPCVSWPELYCHTLQGLRPGQTYNVAVSALNKNKPEPGESALTSGLAREKSPGAPENLKVVNMTSTTVAVQWDPPFMQNGILRTFLVSVEELETHNEETCCQTFPVLEKTVSEEVLHHQLEISGLSPASVYTISVAGRTNGFGPAQTLSVTTRPPPLLVSLPEQLVLDCGHVTWLPENTTAHTNDSVYQSLVVYRCILVLQNSTLNSVVNVESGIKDQRLKELLDDQLEFVYYLAAEYEVDETVHIPGDQESSSTWGQSRVQALDRNTSYQLAAVQVTEYNGVLNADILLSTPLTGC